LAIDTLQRVFELADSVGTLSSLRGRRCTTLRLSLYDDDAVVFTNPDKHDISMVMDIINLFGKATGLTINLAKSAVATICCANLDLEEIMRPFPRNRGKFSDKLFAHASNTWPTKDGAPTAYTGQSKGPACRLARKAAQPSRTA
jgi:hypothetical protein